MNEPQNRLFTYIGRRHYTAGALREFNDFKVDLDALILEGDVIVLLEKIGLNRVIVLPNGRIRVLHYDFENDSREFIETFE